MEEEQPTALALERVLAEARLFSPPVDLTVDLDAVAAGARPGRGGGDGGEWGDDDDLWED